MLWEESRGWETEITLSPFLPPKAVLDNSLVATVPPATARLLRTAGSHLPLGTGHCRPLSQKNVIPALEKAAEAEQL